MPQGYITRIEKDLGWVRPAGGSKELVFKHWALAAEQGGRFPAVGSYVQWREVKDPAHGTYLTEIRQLTPPAEPADGKFKNVYDNDPKVPTGIQRVVGPEGRVPLEQALREEEAAADAHEPLARVTRPTGPLHQPVATEWQLPSDTEPSESTTTAQEGKTT